MTPDIVTIYHLIVQLPLVFLLCQYSAFFMKNKFILGNFEILKCFHSFVPENKNGSDRQNNTGWRRAFSKSRDKKRYDG